MKTSGGGWPPKDPKKRYRGLPQIEFIGRKCVGFFLQFIFARHRPTPDDSAMRVPIITCPLFRLQVSNFAPASCLVGHTLDMRELPAQVQRCDSLASARPDSLRSFAFVPSSPSHSLAQSEKHSAVGEEVADSASGGKARVSSILARLASFPLSRATLVSVLCF